MRNESHAFAYHSEKKESIEAAEKKSAAILQFPSSKTNKTDRMVNNVNQADTTEDHQEDGEIQPHIELQKIEKTLKEVEMETFNFINDELLGSYFWEFDRSMEHDLYKDFVVAKLKKEFEDDFNRTVDTKRRDGIENETGGNVRSVELLSYAELWEKYHINQSAIIDKYIAFVDNHLNGVKQYIAGAVGDDEKQAEFVKKFEKWQTRKGEITKWRDDLSNKKKELFEIKNADLANKVSAKYQEIIALADNLIEKVQSNFQSGKDISPEDIHELRYSLVHRAEEVYQSFIAKIKNSEAPEQGNILSDIEKIEQDTIFFTNLFKSFAKNNPEISFEDFKGLSFETKTGKDLEDEQDISQMVSIVQKNYASDPSMQKLVIESLHEGLQKGNSEFNVLRNKGDIVAFCRFDDEGDHFYAGSFNVDPDYRGSAIGEVMMRESLDKKAQEKPVVAITDPKKIICSKYVEDEGFIISGILYTEFEGKTLEEVDIVRDDMNNKNYAYRQNGITRENILDIYQDQKNNKRSDVIKSKNPFIVQFTKDETSRFLNVADKLCKGYGYAITRYLPADNNEEKMLAAFEQKL